jgi:hypothetical protein
MRTLAMPKAAELWSLTSLRDKLIKIGAKVVSHGRYVTIPNEHEHLFTPDKQRRSDVRSLRSGGSRVSGTACVSRMPRLTAPEPPSRSAQPSPV